jgi:hypothetical protein
MKTKLIAVLSILSFFGCSVDDVKPTQRKGFLSLSAQVDARVRFKGALIVDNYDVKIVSKTDANFSYSNKVSTIGTNPVELAVGEYTVKVNSSSVILPDFDLPTYGVSQDFVITAGNTTNLSLVCKQTNAGVKVGYSDAFRKYCTDNSLVYSTTIEQNGSSLTYANTETRAGYFNPGNVNVTVSVGDKEYTSTLTLAAQDLVNLAIDLAPDDPSKLSLSITGVDDVNIRDEKITISLKPNASTETLKLSEDFTTLTVGSNTSTSGGGSSWNGNENFPSTSTAYNAAGAVKLGGTSSGGSITSKTLDLSANNGNVTVKVKVKGWTTVESDLKIKVGNVEKIVPYTAVMANVFEEVTATFPNAGTVSSTVTITSATKRLFIDEIKVYN